MPNALRTFIVGAQNVQEGLGITKAGIEGGNDMIDRLVSNIQKTKAPIVVGLDPMLSYIPEPVKAAAFSALSIQVQRA